MFMFKHTKLPWLDKDSNHCTKLHAAQHQIKPTAVQISGYLMGKYCLYLEGNKKRQNFYSMFHKWQQT